MIFAEEVAKGSELNRKWKRLSLTLIVEDAG